MLQNPQARVDTHGDIVPKMLPQRRFPNANEVMDAVIQNAVRNARTVLFPIVYPCQKHVQIIAIALTETRACHTEQMQSVRNG